MCSNDKDGGNWIGQVGSPLSSSRINTCLDSAVMVSKKRDGSKHLRQT